MGRASVWMLPGRWRGLESVQDERRGQDGSDPIQIVALHCLFHRSRQPGLVRQHVGWTGPLI